MEQRHINGDGDSLDCWTIQIDNEIWFEAYDLAVLYGYEDPDEAIHKIFST
jgi:prophage antirepressor-like protein